MNVSKHLVLFAKKVAEIGKEVTAISEKSMVIAERTVMTKQELVTEELQMMLMPVQWNSEASVVFEQGGNHRKLTQ